MARGDISARRMPPPDLGVAMPDRGVGERDLATLPTRDAFPLVSNAPTSAATSPLRCGATDATTLSPGATADTRPPGNPVESVPALGIKSRAPKATSPTVALDLSPTLLLAGSCV